MFFWSLDELLMNCSTILKDIGNTILPESISVSYTFPANISSNIDGGNGLVLLGIVWNLKNFSQVYVKRWYGLNRFFMLYH